MDLRSLPDPLPIEPLAGPLDATVQVPGSKSITNRALVCAALAAGHERARRARCTPTTPRPWSTGFVRSAS